MKMKSPYVGWISLEGVAVALGEMGYETLDSEPGRWTVFRSQSPEVQAFVAHTERVIAAPDMIRSLLAGEPPDVADAAIARALEIDPDAVDNCLASGIYPKGITVRDLDRIQAHMPKPPPPTPEQIERMKRAVEILAKIDKEAGETADEDRVDASGNYDEGAARKRGIAGGRFNSPPKDERSAEMKMKSPYVGWISLEGVAVALGEMGYETLDSEPGRWTVFRSQSPEVQAFVAHTERVIAAPDMIRSLLAGEPPDVADAAIARALEIDPDAVENCLASGIYPKGITMDEFDRIQAHMPKPPPPTPEQIERMRLTDKILAKIDKEASEIADEDRVDASVNYKEYLYGGR